MNAKLTATDYRQMAHYAVKHGYVDLDRYYTAYYRYMGVVVAKQRPRAGKNGQIYTPKETRRFEASVKKWATQLGEPKLAFPIKIKLTINEPTKNKTLFAMSSGGLVYNDKQDIDNLAKAVLDGLNKILYCDDKQVSKLMLSRRYVLEKDAGFNLAIVRDELSKNEYQNFLKYYRVEKERNEKQIS